MRKKKKGGIKLKNMVSFFLYIFSIKKPGCFHKVNFIFIIIYKLISTLYFHHQFIYTLTLFFSFLYQMNQSIDLFFILFEIFSSHSLFDLTSEILYFTLYFSIICRHLPKKKKVVMFLLTKQKRKKDKIHVIFIRKIKIKIK